MLRVGNIHAKRDWGHAFDYIVGYWKMLNEQSESEDYVLATSESVSVKTFAERAFREAGFLSLEW